MLFSAGYSILAHSRPDKIGTPRLVPLDLYEYFIGLSAKKSAQMLYPALTELKMLSFLQVIY
jgi:hypothetical protein